jgi:DNA-binding beta-propeller fold protein YncE
MRIASHMRGSLATLTLALLVLLGLISLASAQRPGAAGEATAGRLVQPRGPDGCVHRRAVNRCARGRFVTSPEDVVVSPDGRHVYVASYGSHAVAIFARARRTGYLRQLGGVRGCVRHQREAGRVRNCVAARALGGPVAIAISPDGRSVYVAAAGSDALSVFARDRRTGALRQLGGAAGCLSQRPGAGCGPARALNEPTSVAVSPDGARVYVTGRRFPSAVAIFTRARDGTLSQPAGTAGCVSHRGGSGCALGRAISSPEEVAVTPDSRHVLVAGMRSRAVAVLTAGPNGLAQAADADGCISLGGRDGCASGRALLGPVDLAVSPDGRYVYAASSVADAVAVLHIDRTTGALTQPRGRRGCLGQGTGARRCAPGRALDEPWGIAMSPDGRNVYVVSAKINTLAVAARNRETGGLSQLSGRLGCFIRAGGFGCPEGRGLTVAVAVAVSPDGRNVYVASEDAYLGSVAVFRRSVR